LGQVLTALKINLTLLEKHIQQNDSSQENDFLITELNDMESIIDITIKKVRKLITNLRPEVLDNLGLIEALEWQSAEFQKNTGIKCNYSSNVESIDLEKDIPIAIFRIYQEALTNVARHSRATRVSSNFLKNHQDIQLRVSDNGIGLNNTKLNPENSFGILGMKERAIICGGTIEFESNEDSGTTVILKIPYNN
jgi:signal transduction histidine kinase